MPAATGSGYCPSGPGLGGPGAVRRLDAEGGANRMFGFVEGRRLVFQSPGEGQPAAWLAEEAGEEDRGAATGHVGAGREVDQVGAFAEEEGADRGARVDREG